MNPLLAKPIIDLVGNVFERVFPDKEQAAKAKQELESLYQAGELKELEAVVSIVTSEANSEHWLVAAWRPITMLTFVAIIANNYLLYPYLSLFWSDAPVLSIPPDMWDLLKLGLGGYVVGRSAEKVANAKWGKK